MGARHDSKWRAAWFLCLVAAVATHPLRAADAWQILPPTPELPPGTTGHYHSIHGARIWYAEWGRQNPGIPVLLLHGGFANSNYYGELIPALIAEGYHVIVMDSRGHGRSTAPNAPLTYHLMAGDALSLLDALKIKRVKLVGWSDGGNTGLDIALHHPDRLTSLFAFGANADVSGAIDGGDKTPVFAAYVTRAREEHRALSPAPDQLAGFDAAVFTMWSTLPNFTAEQLQSIKVPTAIADGEYDEVIKPEHTKYVAATIPGARLIILPKVSHFAMLQNPAAFNTTVLDFLRKH